ncbi:unnamed protein product [Rhizophagus irregularis]|nr:unnamed protein product [Rhizophagus irregularis]
MKGEAKNERKGSGGLPKNGKPKDSFRRASKKRKTKDSRLSRLPCSEERKKPRFVNGLLTFGKRETKIRLTVRESRFVNLGSVGFQRSKKPRFISFGELLKNEKELKFELWGFLSLFPSHLPSPLSFFPAIPLSLTFHLGIEINSFALPESNCFGFLILDNRID